jgi:glycosyltransferase involved in cell wall biosynthesis
MVKDLVSVVVPTYNDAPYLEVAIEDLINQTYSKIEILIINDGSTDKTEEILKKYIEKDKRIRYFYKENGGTGSALNMGFEKATGEFGTWISSDDRKNPNMIERLVNFLKKERDIEYVTSAFESEYLGKVLRSYTPDPTSIKGHRHNYFSAPNIGKTSGKEFKVDDWVDINFRECHQGVNFMFTMNLKNRCGKYIEIPGEDYYMAAKLGMNSRVGYIDEVLGKHQSPPDSLSVVNRACVAEANVLTRNLIKNNYKQWHLNKIPKVAHFYWDSSKLSYMRYMTLESFKKFNPDWSAILYVPHDYDTINRSHENWKDVFHRSDSADYKSEKNYFEKVKEIPGLKIVKVDFSKVLPNSPPAHRSDYIRWNLLPSQGGLWCDMDILFFKPMADIALNNPDFKNADTVVCYDPRHSGISIGFLMSSRGGEFFTAINKKSIQTLKYLKEGTALYQSFGCLMINKIYPTPEAIKVIHPSSNLINLNICSVYFYDHKQLEKVYHQKNLNHMPPESIGIHWYGGHPDSQKMNNIINHENYKQFDNTLSEILEYISKQNGIK